MPVFDLLLRFYMTIENEMAESHQEQDENLENDQLIDDTEELSEDETQEPEEETETEESEEVETEGDGEESDEEEEVLTIDGEEVAPASEEKKTPQWVKDLRKDNRHLIKRVKELESQQAPEKEEEALGDRPKLEDFEYDEEAYSEAHEKWFTKKQAVEAKKKATQEEQERQQQEWQSRLDDYDSQKTTFIEKRPDYEDAEEKVKSEVDEVTQNLIVLAPESARLVYVLGKQPDKLAAVKEAKTPLEKMYQLGLISASIKTEVRKKPSVKAKTKVNGGAIKTVSQAQQRLNELGKQRATADVISESRKLRKQIRQAQKR